MHNFCNKKCARVCTILLQSDELWDMGLVYLGFVEQVYCIIQHSVIDGLLGKGSYTWPSVNYVRKIYDI